MPCSLSKRVVRFHLVTTAILLGGLATVYAQVPAGANRPATVPEGYLITPMGYFHPSCVKQVAKGDVLHPDEMAIHHADGSFDSMQVCAYPHFTAKGEKVALEPAEKGPATSKASVAPLNASDETKKPEEPPFIGHSWIEALFVESSTSYGEVTSEYKIPSAPTSHDGQTIYFFPGLQDLKSTKTETILQPVVGWNAYFNNEWGIASWNCCVKNTLYVSTPEKAKTGDKIYGQVINQCKAGTLECGKWTVRTEDKTTGAYSDLFNESNFGQTFNWGFGSVLEVYNVAKCSDYPPGGKLESTSVTFYNDKFQKIADPTWYILKAWEGPPAVSPICNYGGYLDNSSGSSQTITY
jgi:hypothetical protein